MMQPLRLDKGPRCCHVKASYPRRAILHKERILHECAPQSQQQRHPLSRKWLVTQTFDSDNNSDECLRNITVQISDWLF